MPDPDERAVYSIGAVARMLDVPTSTLRAWEERYGVVTPNRSDGSQRLYSRSQVEQLRYIKDQIDSGLSAADSHRLLAQDRLAAAGDADDEIDRVLEQAAVQDRVEILVPARQPVGQGVTRRL